MHWSRIAVPGGVIGGDCYQNEDGGTEPIGSG